MLALKFNINFSSISLDMTKSKPGGLHGADESQKKDNSNGYVKMLLAGLISEILIHGNPEDLISPDLQKLSRDGRFGFIHDFKQVEPIIEEVTGEWAEDDSEKYKMYVNNMWNDVVVYLKDQMQNIKGLAELLQQKRQLPKSEIEKFLSANAK